MTYATKLDKPQKIKITDFDPSETGKLNKEDALVQIESLESELAELQELLYASQKNSVLIVLQGVDTSGKDGTIGHVMGHVNPQGCSVASFKVPTTEESMHDFLWRIHAKTPARGNLTIFNRSHYEDVLATIVHKVIDGDECRTRYQQINAFEKMLAENGTIILKFYLHIGRAEQKERLLEREQDPEKAWKLSPADWKEREKWDAYEGAYSDAIGATSQEYAPWYVIPANKKWYRNLLIAEVIVKSMRKHKDSWNDVLKDLGKAKLKELRQMRADKEIPPEPTEKKQ